MPDQALTTGPQASEADVADIIEIRDPEIDVEALMARVRENVARRRAEGAYREDLDAIAEAVRAGVLAAPDTTGLPADAPEGPWEALNAAWSVREVPFTSPTPVLGPLIVAFRNAWNWVSTKWYVRAILQQQVSYNALVAQAFAELHAEHQTLTEEVAELRATCERQQKDLQTLAEELERLHASR